MRLRIDLAYDGTAFHGWAVQPGLRTVQGDLEGWLTRLLRLDSPATLIVAGRTDAGVHARGQVCHLDVPGQVDLVDLTRRLRKALPADVVVRDVREVPAEFDARFSALWRRYCYRLCDETAVPDPLHRGHVARVPHAVDVDAVNAGAATLLGLRDFAPFCKPRDGATTIRDLREVRAHRLPDGSVEIWLQADAFCHSMVRSLVGALTAVGGGRRTLAWLEDVAASPVRHGEVLVMPARGLTLEEVGYPADHELAARSRAARAVRTLEDA